MVNTGDRVIVSESCSRGLIARGGGSQPQVGDKLVLRENCGGILYASKSVQPQVGDKVELSVKCPRIMNNGLTGAGVNVGGVDTVIGERAGLESECVSFEIVPQYNPDFPEVHGWCGFRHQFHVSGVHINDKNPWLPGIRSVHFETPHLQGHFMIYHCPGSYIPSENERDPPYVQSRDTFYLLHHQSYNNPNFSCPYWMTPQNLQENPPHKVDIDWLPYMYSSVHMVVDNHKWADTLTNSEYVAKMNSMTGQGAGLGSGTKVTICPIKESDLE